MSHEGENPIDQHTPFPPHPSPQVADCFIVIRCDAILCIWDQHALHERIRIESFLSTMDLPHQQVIRQLTKPFKPLVFPNYPPDDLELLREPTTRAFLARFFLDYQLVKTSVLVRTRPVIVEEPLPDVTELLPALLRDLRDIQSRPGADPMQVLQLLIFIPSASYASNLPRF